MSSVVGSGPFTLIAQGFPCGYHVQLTDCTTIYLGSYIRSPHQVPTSDLLSPFLLTWALFTMILSRYILPLVLLLINEGASKVVWSPCNAGEFDTTLKIDCSNVTVPLDYTQPKSNKTLTLEIVRVPAIVKPSKGSIFLLFGGPGYDARQHLVYYGANLRA